MLFNSVNFLFFIIITYTLYWSIPNNKIKSQNILLLIASLFFYGFWNWNFLLLLIFSIVMDFLFAIKIEKSKAKIKKIWFYTSLLLSFGFLFFFKYYNFFIESFTLLLSKLGLSSNPLILKIILPIGISFYTFHSVSYIVDVYKNKINAERNIVSYALFVSFFPLLVAGPIERATHLLPQIKSTRFFNYKTSVDGLKQILWGLFKKIVIADSCAILADQIFQDYNQLQGPILLLGAFIFAIQIYGDFSGYSDIALGVANLFGFKLLDNFRNPYFSRDIAEFWRRWHISLSSWFKDYLYIPLGGSKKSLQHTIINTFIIFLVSGFWHGANWTFIFWGGLHAVFFLPLLLSKKNRININSISEDKFIPSLKDFLFISKTFILVSIAWIFFRSENLTSAFNYLYNLLNGFFEKKNVIEVYNYLYWKVGFGILFFIFFMFLIEWIGRNNIHPLEKIGFKWNSFFRLLFYTCILIIIYVFIKPTNQTFIYFQF